MAVVEIGRRFTRLTVLQLTKVPGKKGRRYLCACDCGRETVVLGAELVRPRRPARSCGCFNRENRITHGHTTKGHWSREYQCWKNMRHRCENPKADYFADYGGRGIRVCAEWTADFSTFFAHVGPKPTPIHTLDRIDPDGHYEPGNVRWATPTEQQRNRRGNRRFAHDGRNLTIPEWSEVTGMKQGTLYMRLVTLNWPVHVALTAPLAK